jgi:hypothetical protein
MTYKTLMVHLKIGQSNAGLLRIADDLAQSFQARLIGVAVCQPMRLLYNAGYMPAGLIEDDRQNMEQQTAATEAEFRTVIQQPAGDLDWRSTITLDLLSNYLAGEARNADLVITSVDHKASSFDVSRNVNVGDLVMQVGRPLLVVPSTLGKLKLERIVVAWDDSREARRATLDALPFLKRAAHVAVVQIADDDYLPSWLPGCAATASRRSRSHRSRWVMTLPNSAPSPAITVPNSSWREPMAIAVSGNGSSAA